MRARRACVCAMTPARGVAISGVLFIIYCPICVMDSRQEKALVRRQKLAARAAAATAAAAADVARADANATTSRVAAIADEKRPLLS